MGNFIVSTTLPRVINYDRKVFYKIDHRLHITFESLAICNS